MVGVDHRGARSKSTQLLTPKPRRHRVPLPSEHPTEGARPERRRAETKDSEPSNDEQRRRHA